MPERLTGTVTRLLPDKGFGFIEAPDGSEYFFHRSGMEFGEFAALSPDALVSFDGTMGPKGLRAEAVRLELPGLP